MNYEVKRIAEKSLYGWSKQMTGTEMADFDNMTEISKLKADFTMALVKEQELPKKLSESSDKTGYAVGQNLADGYHYFVGASTEITAPDRLIIPEQDYIVLSDHGGSSSRVLLDNLIDDLFNKILPENDDKFAFEDSFVVEVFKNGSPENAQVEIWFPVKSKRQ